MNRILQILITIAVSTTVYGQNVSVKTEKTEYKIEETITLVYEVKAKVDSVSKLTVGNFKIINGPRTSQSVSTINGQTTLTYNLTYEIKANASGTIEIISPTFYSDNQESIAEKLNLTISGNKLSDKEIEELNFNEFKDNSFKPNGTLRYVLSETFGFVEEFNDFQWTFKRKLTKREIGKFRKK